MKVAARNAPGMSAQLHHSQLTACAKTPEAPAPMTPSAAVVQVEKATESDIVKTDQEATAPGVKPIAAKPKESTDHVISHHGPDTTVSTPCRTSTHSADRSHRSA